MSFSNPDELFDIVDAHDCVVRQAPRREVHARGWWHRAVHVLIHNARGEVFLQQRSPLKDTFPGCWDSSCSGHVDAGELYAAAAIRELGEELSLRAIPAQLQPVTRLTPGEETGWEFIQIYLLGPVEGPFVLNAEEISAGRWIEPHALVAELGAQPEAFTSAVRFLWAKHAPELFALLPPGKSRLD